MSYEDYLKGHSTSDTDTEPSAIHHTVGKGPNQSAAGNHKHDDRYELLGPASQGNVPVGAVFMWPNATGVPSNYLELIGQTINFATWPKLFEAYGDVNATMVLPDYRDRFPVGASGTKAVKSTGGSDSHGHAIAETTTTVETVVTTPKTVVATTPDIVATDNLPKYLAIRFLVRAA